MSSTRSRRTTLVAALAVTTLVSGGLAALAAGTGTVDAPPRTAFVARSDNPADALAAGPIAGRLAAPIFTTPPTSLAEEARDGLIAYEPQLVILTGGTAALSPDVEAAVEAALGLPDDAVVRVFGDNRHATAAALAATIAASNPAFLPVGATAEDAELLDGMDSTEFMAADADTASPMKVALPAAGGTEGLDTASSTVADSLAGYTQVNFGNTGVTAVNFGLTRPVEWGARRAFDTLTSLSVCYRFDGTVDDGDGLAGITIRDAVRGEASVTNYNLEFATPPNAETDIACAGVLLPKEEGAVHSGVELSGPLSVSVLVSGDAGDSVTFYGFEAKFGPEPARPQFILD